MATMFNALNRFMLRLDGSESQKREQEKGAFGFQVLRNTSLELAIEPWFDYLVGINGRPIENPDPNLFAQEIRNCAGNLVNLTIWSAKGQRTREMHVPVPRDPPLLGLSLQYSPLTLATNVWHVLDVAAHSPADIGGLLPHSDYILGSPEGALHGEAALGELVEDYIGRDVRLYVYNNEYDVTREVSIRPSRDWGGQGALGCVLGYGALHQIPPPLSEPVNAPGETMFDGDENEKNRSSFTTTPVPPPPRPGGDYLVPAQMMDSTTARPPPRSGRRKERHGHESSQFMDDYFREQEEKSRELDNAPPSKGTGVPPPPRAATVASSAGAATEQGAPGGE